MTYTPPVAEIDARRTRALMVGVAGLVVCGIGFFIDRDHFFRSWLIAFLLFLGISLGSMALMMIQHLSGGTWGVFRRVFEASSRTVPFMFVLFVPVILGMTSLYVWTHPEHVQADEILRHKSLYLNTGFFIGRAVLYFAIWSGLSMVLNRLSARQRRRDRPLRTDRNVCGHRLDHVDQPPLVLGAVRLPDDGRARPCRARLHDRHLHDPDQARAAEQPVHTEPLPRSREADVRVRHVVGLFQLLAIPAHLRRESH